MAKKKFYRYPLYLAARILAAVVLRLPRRRLLGLAGWAGERAFGILRHHRRRTLEHLRMAFQGRKADTEIETIGKKVFRNLAETAAEFLCFSKIRLEDIERLADVREAEKAYQELLAEGNGLISLTAHIGNWELLAGIFGLKGYPGAVLGRRIYYEPYNRWIVALRQKAGVVTLYRDDPPKEILKRLKRNEIIGILPDQDIDSLPGIFVDFLGRPAYTIVAPAKMSLASGAPILPNFLIRTETGNYQLVLGKVIRPLQGQGRDEEVKRITFEWMKACESVILEYPEQWAWMHARWKTQPLERGQESMGNPKPARNGVGMAERQYNTNRESFAGDPRVEQL